MSYFKNFSLVRYNDVLQVNITKRASIPSQFKTNQSYWLEYDILEGDSPEIIADKLYDDSSLAWILLDLNNIVNVFDEWPKDYNTLQEFIADKYDNVNGVHHYESIAYGTIVDSDHPAHDLKVVTNTEYEENLNDNKRKIKILLPDFVGDIVASHKEQFRQ